MVTAEIMPQEVNETGEKMPFHLKHEQLMKEYNLKLSSVQLGNLTGLLRCYFHQIQPPFTTNDYILYQLYHGQFCAKIIKGNPTYRFKLQHFQVTALTAVLNDFEVETLQAQDLRTVRDGLVQHQSNLLS